MAAMNTPLTACAGAALALVQTPAAFPGTQQASRGPGPGLAAASTPSARQQRRSLADPLIREQAAEPTPAIAETRAHVPSSSSPGGCLRILHRQLHGWGSHQIFQRMLRRSRKGNQAGAAPEKVKVPRHGARSTRPTCRRIFGTPQIAVRGVQVISMASEPIKVNSYPDGANVKEKGGPSMPAAYSLCFWRLRPVGHRLVYLGQPRRTTNI